VGGIGRIGDGRISLRLVRIDSGIDSYRYRLSGIVAEPGYIRPSKLLIRYPILFVSKKNGKLRIYVNYRKLNDIIIKNRYTLPLIHEIQNRIRKIKFFIRFDL
jgi:hypothetical protein